MVGLNISAGLNSIVTIYILIPLILVPQLLLGGAMIKFDELHYGLSNKIHVPFTGNAMVSRWAYEALAAEQFKNNQYEINYYEYDRLISHSAYQSSFLIPRLERRLDTALSNFQQGDTTAGGKDLRLIRNEFEIIASKDDNHSFNRFNTLTTGYFDESSYNIAKSYLNTL